MRRDLPEMNNLTEQLIESVRGTAAGYFDPSKGSHGMDHTERVYSLCMHLGNAEHADMDVLRFAALLHDIGRPEEDRKKGSVCHAELGARTARGILEPLGIAAGIIDHVCACISTHRFRDEKKPETLEARILFDADKLDSIGAAGIGRAFLFAGEVGARLHNNSVAIEDTKPYTAEDTAYREFMVKLRFVRDRMCTEEGKRLALERHDYMVGFFERLDREVRGEV